MCRCVVDRNTVAADRICKKLNRLLASVRSALLNYGLRMEYAKQIHAPPDFFNWVDILDNEGFDNFFTDFAGQGRIRWHYGVAHPLLCSFEDSFMADHGRGWLPENNANRARTFVRTNRTNFFLFSIENNCTTCSGSILTCSAPETCLASQFSTLKQC